MRGTVSWPGRRPRRAGQGYLRAAVIRICRRAACLCPEEWGLMEAVMTGCPQLLHTAIDTTDAWALAEFHRQLLGLRYRQGNEPPAGSVADDADRLVLVDRSGHSALAFQQVERLERTTWPKPDVPTQMHLDFTVSSLGELHWHRQRVESLGAQLLLYRTDRRFEPPQQPAHAAPQATHRRLVRPGLLHPGLKPRITVSG
jgi:hypothetical protein